MAETPDDGELSEPLQGVGARQQSLRWTIPEPLAVCETHGLDGAPITLRRHGNPDGPRLVLSHANGLSADSYYPFWSLLSDRFDIILYDFRNHGWNPVGDLRTHNIWFAPEVPAQARPMNGGLRQYIRPLSGTVLVPGHDGLRAPRSS